MDYLAELTTWHSMCDWQIQAILRILTAAILGSIIGAEREFRGRTAGFRTQLLVAVGSALVMVISLRFADTFGASPSQAIKVDPARIAYGVMVGIGFLGAGAIIRQGPDIRGLTTAASLWCTAAVGMACGFGMFIIAAFVTAVCLFTLVVLQKVEPYIHIHHTKLLTLVLPYTKQDNIKRFQKLLSDLNVHNIAIQHSVDLQQQTETIVFQLNIHIRQQKYALTDLAELAPDLLRFSLE